MSSPKLAESTRKAASEVFRLLKEKPMTRKELLERTQMPWGNMNQGIAWLSSENMVEMDRRGDRIQYFLTNWAKYRRRIGRVETGANPLTVREWKAKDYSKELGSSVLGACSFDYISVMEIADNICEDVLTVNQVVNRLYRDKKLHKRGDRWKIRSGKETG